MNPWESLIEARIKEWQERRAKGEDRNPNTREASFESLETQLFNEIIEMRRRAANSELHRCEILLRQAEEARSRLAIILEKNGLLLMAQSLDERLQQHLGESRPEKE